MSIDSFVDRYNGKKVDYDGRYGSQCMDLYRQYCKEVLEIPQSPGVVGAKDVWETYLEDQFTAIPYPTGVPQKGDVIIWGTEVGKYGHIAIVLSGDQQRFVSFDQNWRLDQTCYLENHSYAGVLGWLRPNQLNDIDMDEVKKLIDDLRIELKAYVDSKVSHRISKKQARKKFVPKKKKSKKSKKN